MRIMAIDALYEAFVHTMVEGASKLLLDLEMAGEAELRLGFLQKELRFLGVVWVVAIGAADIILQVRRATEVGVFSTILVAAQAARADVFGGRVLEREDLRFIATTLDVFLARPVASLATVPFGTAPRIKSGSKMRRRFELLEKTLRRHVLMAGLASFLADVKRRVSRTLVVDSLTAFLIGRRGLRSGGRFGILSGLG